MKWSTVSESTHPKNKTLKVMKCLESFKYEYINYCVGKIYKEDTCPIVHCFKLLRLLGILYVERLGFCPMG